MAILKSTQVKGDLSVTGNLNVQGDLTYVGVNNLRVKDHQIELNATDSGSASLAGADEAGIVIRGAKNTTVNPSSEEASILYNHADDTLVVNKTIKGTVSNATTAASANKVANKLTVNVTDETGSVKTVEFDGSEVKTVDVNLKGLQDQINSLTGGTSSVATQISNAINDLNSNVTAEATGTATKDGVFVLQSVKIDESAGKLTLATPTAVEVEKAGAAAAAKTELIGKGNSDKDSDTIEGAKRYADDLAAKKANASHKHEIGDVNGLQAALDGKAAVSHKHAIADVTNLQAALDAKQDALANAATLATITPIKVSNWDDAATKAHEHTNKEVLDGITAEKVAAWDGAVSAARVSSVGGKSGALTLKGGSATLGDVNLSISNTGEISAAIVPDSFDVKGAANDALDAAKAYADEKVTGLKNTVDSLNADVLKSVAAGDYVSVSTKSGNSQTISVTTEDVATASGNANGLALAADVKKYVDGKNADQDTKIANIENGKTLDSRYVNADGDTMTGKLTMNAADIEMSNSGIVFGNMKIVWNVTDNAIEFIPTTA